MLDRLFLHIPFDASLVDVSDDGHHCILGFDILDLDLKKVGSWDVYKDQYGKPKATMLNHAYEHLPSSYTKMAFKVFHEGRSFPYVELKASPAKILQGHNVYGTDKIAHGAMEMLGLLAEAHPTLYGMLAVSKTEVKSFDVTYSARLRDDVQVAKVLDFMRQVSSGGIRKSTKQVTYGNTVYFGSERAKRFARKVYGKACEFNKQLEEQTKLAKANDTCAKRVVEVMSDPKLQAWVKGLLRFETGVKAYAMKKMGIPTNLFELIRYQIKNPNFMREVWVKANAELFKALEGQTMRTTDHDVIYDALVKVFGKVTPTGRVSVTKARNLFNFYVNLENLGCESLKKRFCERQYYQHFGDLVKSGLFSKAYLQNLEKNKNNDNNVIPFLKLIEVNFDEQLPPDFVEPKSQFHTQKLKVA